MVLKIYCLQIEHFKIGGRGRRVIIMKGTGVLNKVDPLVTHFQQD
jgi:hypothetical protein